MDLKILLTVFATIFLAEIGDKTQLATVLFATDGQVAKLTVFLGASLALVLAAGIGVAVGGAFSHYVGERALRVAAGAAFIGVGIWTLLRA